MLGPGWTLASNPGTPGQPTPPYESNQPPLTQVAVKTVFTVSTVWLHPYLHWRPSGLHASPPGGSYLGQAEASEPPSALPDVPTCDDPALQATATSQHEANIGRIRERSVQLKLTGTFRRCFRLRRRLPCSSSRGICTC